MRPSTAQLSVPQMGYGGCFTSGDRFSAAIQQLHVAAELPLDLRCEVRMVRARDGGKVGHSQRVDVTSDLFSDRATECRRSSGFVVKMMEVIGMKGLPGGIDILPGREPVPEVLQNGLSARFSSQSPPPSHPPTSRTLLGLMPPELRIVFSCSAVYRPLCPSSQMKCPKRTSPGCMLMLMCCFMLDLGVQLYEETQNTDLQWKSKEVSL